MISGDHLETCKFVAVMTGIISREDLSNEDVCMTGEQFRSKIGEWRKVYDPVTENFKVEFDEP